jgi:hypothetical protein
MQRADRARAERCTRQQVEEENRALAKVAIARTQARSPRTSDEIKAKQLLARRRRMESSNPSASPAAQNTTRKGGGALLKGAMRYPRAAGPGEKDIDIHREGFSLICFILISLGQCFNNISINPRFISTIGHVKCNN